MAKKKEQAAAVPDQAEVPQAAATPETTEEPRETAAPEIAEEPQETAAPETVEKPQEAETLKARDISEIMNNEAELVEETPVISETEGNGQPELEDKILFYVKTVNDKTAVRSAPEYPMAGASNVIDIITDRGPYGIVDVENGFGRIAGGTGWIMLDSSVVMRQG